MTKRLLLFGACLVFSLCLTRVSHAQVSGQTYGGTATTTPAAALSTNTNRRGFIVQDTGASCVVYAACATKCSTVTTATAHQIIAGGNWESPPLLGACSGNVCVLTSTSTCTYAATDY